MAHIGNQGLAKLWELIVQGFAKATHSHTASDLPTASPDEFGIVKPDGVSIVTDNGVLSVSGGVAAEIPLGTLLWSTSAANPGGAGVAGTWQLATVANIPFSDDETLYHVWIKTAHGSGSNVLPVHSVIWSTSDRTPNAEGYAGVWQLKCKAFIPLTDSETVYRIYERIE